MIRHTAGPWLRTGTTVYALVSAGWRRGVEQFKNRFTIQVQRDHECPEEEAVAIARLCEAAPAMDLALSLIASGSARIEPARGEPGQNGVRAFCFDGSRYIIDGDWNGLFEVIGWDKAIAAAEKAEGGAA